METVAIKACEAYREREVLALYESVGWSAYYTRPELLREAFAASLCIYGAYHGERLVGLIRAVGDGCTVVFIQDVLVHPAYQRRGIGSMLVGAVKARFSQVRQMHLITDDIRETAAFYRSAGFLPVEQMHCRAFTKP